MNKRWANRLHRKADRFKAELWQGNGFGLRAGALGQRRETSNQTTKEMVRALTSRGYDGKAKN